MESIEQNKVEAQEQQPQTWAERQAARTAAIAANGGRYIPPQHGPDFGHGITRYNLPRSTTKGGRR